jgi:hypothetical protein
MEHQKLWIRWRRIKGLPQEPGNQKYLEEQATLQQQVILEPKHA